MSKVLEWQNICFEYEENFQLKGVNYALNKGDFTLFFGPNGAGKTTLFKIAMGWLKPTRGQVLLNGENVAKLPVIDIAKQAAYLEQEIHHIFPFTVEEIVLMGRFPHTANQFWDRKEDLEVAAWAMEKTGLLPFAKRSIFHLSGGERRKVEIARALCQRPKILFLDEPTTFLDIKQQVELFELLSRLNQEEKITIALISHQIHLARHYVSHGALMRDGQLVEQDRAEIILDKKKIAAFFNIKEEKVNF